MGVVDVVGKLGVMGVAGVDSVGVAGYRLTLSQMHRVGCTPPCTSSVTQVHPRRTSRQRASQ